MYSRIPLTISYGSNLECLTIRIRIKKEAGFGSWSGHALRRTAGSGSTKNECRFTALLTMIRVRYGVFQREYVVECGMYFQNGSCVLQCARVHVFSKWRLCATVCPSPCFPGVPVSTGNHRILLHTHNKFVTQQHTLAFSLISKEEEKKKKRERKKGENNNKNR